MFGQILADARRAQRLSQAELAARAGLSQRHVSFLETGRAQPGPRAIAALIDGLVLATPDADRLLAAAGLRSPRAALAWEDPALAEARAVIAMMLERHAPWPALAIDRSGVVRATNSGLDMLLAEAEPDRDLWSETRPNGVRNLYDLTLHPAGLVRFMADPEPLIAQTLLRLKRAAGLHAGAAATLARVLRYPAVRALRRPAPALAPAGVLTEDYRLGASTLRLISTTSCFGSPEDETASHIQVENFYPADAVTTAYLAALSRTPPAVRSVRS